MGRDATLLYIQQALSTGFLFHFRPLRQNKRSLGLCIVSNGGGAKMQSRAYQMKKKNLAGLDMLMAESLLRSCAYIYVSRWPEKDESRLMAV